MVHPNISVFYVEYLDIRARCCYEIRKTQETPNITTLQAVNEYTQAEVKNQQEEAKKLRLQVRYGSCNHHIIG